MPGYKKCAVKNCSESTKHRAPGVSFYQFPTVREGNSWNQREEALLTERRAIWLLRTNVTEEQLLRNPSFSVCSRHFILGKPSYELLLNNLDWAPTQFLEKEYATTSAVKRFKRGIARKAEIAPGPMETPGKKTKKDKNGNKFCDVSAAPNNDKSTNCGVPSEGELSYLDLPPAGTSTTFDDGITGNGQQMSREESVALVKKNQSSHIDNCSNVGSNCCALLQLEVEKFNAEKDMLQRRILELEARLQWQKLMKNPGLKASSKLSDIHFDPDDVVKGTVIQNQVYPLKNWHLKKNAVPKHKLDHVPLHGNCKRKSVALQSCSGNSGCLNPCLKQVLREESTTERERTTISATIMSADADHLPVPEFDLLHVTRDIRELDTHPTGDKPHFLPVYKDNLSEAMETDCASQVSSVVASLTSAAADHLPVPEVDPLRVTPDICELDSYPTGDKLHLLPDYKDNRFEAMETGCASQVNCVVASLTSAAGDHMPVPEVDPLRVTPDNCELDARPIGDKLHLLPVSEDNLQLISPSVDGISVTQTTDNYCCPVLHPAEKNHQWFLDMIAVVGVPSANWVWSFDKSTQNALCSTVIYHDKRIFIKGVVLLNSGDITITLNGTSIQFEDSSSQTRTANELRELLELVHSETICRGIDTSWKEHAVKTKWTNGSIADFRSIHCSGFLKSDRNTQCIKCSRFECHLKKRRKKNIPLLKKKIIQKKLKYFNRNVLKPESLLTEVQRSL